MARRAATENYFGKRVKDEREARGWSQAQFAQMLSDAGLKMIHPSTVAKIELGTRPSRIDEAVVVADLFGISLDALLGRDGLEDPASHAMTVLAEAAGRLVPEVAMIRDRLHRAYRDLESQFDFAEFEQQVLRGEKFRLSGLPLEQTRARLMWVHKVEALATAAALLDHLSDVRKIRAMSGPEIGRQVKKDEALARFQQRSKELAAEEAQHVVLDTET
jgi:transcriptional regulator with XRE-family HTH domain